MGSNPDNILSFFSSQNFPSSTSQISSKKKNNSARDRQSAVPSTTLSNFARSRIPGNKGRGLSILSLLTIAVLKFQLWNLFCATAWNRNVGAVPKFAQL